MRQYLFIFIFLVFSYPNAFAQDTDFKDAASSAITAEAVQKLAKAISFQTASDVDEQEFRYSEFLSLHDYLGEAFPALHQQLQKEVINGYSLLYTWLGTDPDLPPVLLSAHMDVVPVEEETKHDWQQQPYAGVVKDGYIWGRGALDDKYRVIAIMEAVEQLLQQGYSPERTIYLAFGHDEEVGGTEGAGKISEYLQEQGVKLEAVFDEGLAVAKGILPGVEEPIAFIGTAAKGGMNLQLKVNGEGGHSSAPPRDTPVSILSAALNRLQNTPFEARMIPTTKETMELMANKMGGKYKFAMRHYGLFKGKILKMLAKDQATGALIRTQMTPTVLEAGDTYNVMPRMAKAVLNIRILNGEDQQTVLKHVTKAINDERVQIEMKGKYTPPSPITATDTWTYAALEQSIRETFPKVALVVPALFPGSTDARHYTNLTNNIYRFGPQVVTREDAQLVHNVDERLEVEVFEKSIAFYKTLLRNTCGDLPLQVVMQQEEADLLPDVTDK
ncbi:M20/M25/M40 family metallo-hydrolase [Pontibacter pamirensis]|uniref:M20/M25/M40 family metallo-hydrolase n=1 Tax=Pontibacter pamirensis TaxID=2562824 RepID=UPI001389FE25|nr:M20/M25/M40 family metallo-hydrolase [Pontibacter pamirensis]